MTHQTFKRLLSEDSLFRHPRVRDFCLALVFAVSYAQRPLFHSDQNTYFINALTDAGYGYLAHDWLAGTADPCPLFSLLINVTYRFLHLKFVYLYFVILMGVYFISLLRIVDSQFTLTRSARFYVSYAAALVFIHSEILSHVTEQRFNFRVDELLSYGIPSQKLLGTELLPSSFGVFLLVSIFAFLRSRPYWAVVFLGLAASIHPTYLLSAALLTAAYIVASLLRGKGIVFALKLGFLASACVTPITLYSLTTFSATNPDLYREAMRVIAYERLPDIASIRDWFGVTAVLKLFWMALALWFVRRTALFPILFFVFVAGFLLSLIQFATQSTFLALLFPWRVSAFLMPISTAVILERAFTWVGGRYHGFFEKHERACLPIVAGLLLLTVVGGLGRQARECHKFWTKDFIPAVRYVRQTKAPHDTYLIPPKWWRFRMLTGAPVFVDWKVFRWKDTEAIEWHERLTVAERFYDDATPREEKVRILRLLSAKYRVTHVVDKSWGPSPLSAGLEKVSEAGLYTIYRLTSAADAPP